MAAKQVAISMPAIRAAIGHIPQRLKTESITVERGRLHVSFTTVCFCATFRSRRFVCKKMYFFLLVYLFSPYVFLVCFFGKKVPLESKTRMFFDSFAKMWNF